MGNQVKKRNKCVVLDSDVLTPPRLPDFSHTASHRAMDKTLLNINLRVN